MSSPARSRFEQCSPPDQLSSIEAKLEKVRRRHRCSVAVAEWRINFRYGIRPVHRSECWTAREGGPELDTQVENITRVFSICSKLQHLEIECEGYSASIGAVTDICCRVRLSKGSPLEVRVLGIDYLRTLEMYTGEFLPCFTKEMS